MNMAATASRFFGFVRKLPFAVSMQMRRTASRSPG